MTSSTISQLPPSTKDSTVSGSVENEYDDGSDFEYDNNNPDDDDLDGTGPSESSINDKQKTRSHVRYPPLDKEWKTANTTPAYYPGQKKSFIDILTIIVP